MMGATRLLSYLVGPQRGPLIMKIYTEVDFNFDHNSWRWSTVQIKKAIRLGQQTNPISHSLISHPK